MQSGCGVRGCRCFRGWRDRETILPLITKSTLDRRQYWLAEIVNLSGSFGADAARVEAELSTEVKRDGVSAILDHLRLCGNIPEQYSHDSSEEKLYSKYTDVVLAAALRHLGLRALVMTERGDAADVEAVADDWALVGDAKAFRLSRTAKNQKDFKVEAMHVWKRGRSHALLICPSYQLPMGSSQIYQSAIARDVTILSYAHLSALVSLVEIKGREKATAALLAALKCAEGQNPTKDAVFYWTLINRTMLSSSNALAQLWKDEKQATIEALTAAKNEALAALAIERGRIQRMSHAEAVAALIRDKNLDGRSAIIARVADNGMLNFK